MNVKSVLFVSHVKAEEEVALSLKDVIEQKHSAVLEAFVSNAPTSLTAGSKWLNQIESNLSNAKAILLLATKESVEKKWINFEAGAGFSKNLPVIPLCYSGMSVSSLPQPLCNFQAVDVLDPKFSDKLNIAIQKAMGWPELNICYDSFIAEAIRYGEQSQAIEQLVKEEKAGSLPAELKLQVLFSIADMLNSSVDFTLCSRLKNSISGTVRPFVINVVLEQLRRESLVELSVFTADAAPRMSFSGAFPLTENDTRISILPAGWNYIEQNLPEVTDFNPRAIAGLGLGPGRGGFF